MKSLVFFSEGIESPWPQAFCRSTKHGITIVYKNPGRLPLIIRNNPGADSGVTVCLALIDIYIRNRIHRENNVGTQILFREV